MDKAVQEFIEKAISEAYPEHKLCVLLALLGRLYECRLMNVVLERRHMLERRSLMPRHGSVSQLVVLWFLLVKAAADASVE